MEYKSLNSNSIGVLRHLAHQSGMNKDEIWEYLKANAKSQESNFRGIELKEGELISLVINDVDKKITNHLSKFLLLLPALESLTLMNTLIVDLDFSANEKLTQLWINKSGPINLNIALNQNLEQIEIDNPEAILLSVYCGEQQRTKFFPNNEVVRLVGNSPREIVNYLLGYNWDNNLVTPLAIAKMKKSDLAILSCLNYLAKGFNKYRSNANDPIVKDSEIELILKEVEKKAVHQHAHYSLENFDPSYAYNSPLDYSFFKNASRGQKFLQRPIIPNPEFHRSNFLNTKAVNYDKYKAKFLQKLSDGKISDPSSWKNAAHEVLKYFYPLYFKASKTRALYKERSTYSLSADEELFFEKLLITGLNFLNKQKTIQALTQTADNVFDLVEQIEASGNKLENDQIHYIEFLLGKRTHATFVEPLDFDRLIKCMITFHPKAYISFIANMSDELIKNAESSLETSRHKIFKSYSTALSKSNGKSLSYVLCDLKNGDLEQIKIKMDNSEYGF